MWPDLFCATAQMKGGQAVEGGARVLGAPPLENSHRSYGLGQNRGVRGEATPLVLVMLHFLIWVFPMHLVGQKALKSLLFSC